MTALPQAPAGRAVTLAPLWAVLLTLLLTVAAAPAYAVGWTVGAARRAGRFLADAYAVGHGDGLHPRPGER
jgi:hypothetical protein